MIQGIYGIKNAKNQNWYVGQGEDVVARWREHLKCMDDPKYPIHIDMAEDITSFEFHILEVVDDVNDLDEREKFWIAKLDAYENGYNLTRGGKQPTRGFRLTIDPKEVFQYHLDNPNASTREIGKKFGIHGSTVNEIIIEGGSCCKTVNGHNVPVVLINTLTNEQIPFKSYAEASRYIFEIGESKVKLDTLRKTLKRKKQYRHYLVVEQ